MHPRKAPPQGIEGMQECIQECIRALTPVGPTLQNAREAMARRGLQVVLRLGRNPTRPTPCWAEPRDRCTLLRPRPRAPPGGFAYRKLGARGSELSEGIAS